MVKTTRYLPIGPGGMKCYCCWPKRSPKSRRALFRTAKSRERRAVRQQIRCDIAGDRA